MIRVANRSDVEIHSVVVKFPSQTEMYGKIVPGAATDYRKVDKAYGYAYIRSRHRWETSSASANRLRRRAPTFWRQLHVRVDVQPKCN